MQKTSCTIKTIIPFIFGMYNLDISILEDGKARATIQKRNLQEHI